MTPSVNRLRPAGFEISPIGCITPVMGEPHYSFGPFVLHPGRSLLRDGKAIAIGQRGLLLLEAMLAAEGNVVSKSEIMDQVWPGLTVEDGNITVQIAALRKELGPRSDDREWIVTIPRIGYRIDLAEPPSTRAPAEGGRPALAVLPFINLSGDSSRDYFADGIVEDLITALSRFRSFAVVSRASSFFYKGKALDVRQVARELGVRYVLEGSVRLANERVRVTVQLIDADTGTHLWASSVDGDLGQVFDFQDRITEKVVGLVEPQIRRAEIERARSRWPANPQAYDHFLRALPHFYSRDPAGYSTALGHLAQAIALQPDYAQALAYASWSYARKGLVALTHLTSNEAARCIDLARTALRYGSDDPLVLAVSGHSLLAIGQLRAEGLATVRRAREATPNNGAVLILAGICNMLTGDLDESEACYRRAWQLGPAAPETYESLAGIGFARFFKGDFLAAIDWLQQSQATMVDWPPAYWMLAASYAHLGRIDEARATVQRLLQLAPQTSMARLDVIVSRADARFDLLIDGLARAGLPAV
jgi:TolB-like protein/Flp pilus assembly protein TadD